MRAFPVDHVVAGFRRGIAVLGDLEAQADPLAGGPVGGLAGGGDPVPGGDAPLVAGGAVVADAWFIGAMASDSGLNDGETHNVDLRYTAEESLWESNAIQVASYYYANDQSVIFNLEQLEQNSSDTVPPDDSNSDQSPQELPESSYLIGLLVSGLLCYIRRSKPLTTSNS